MADGKKRFGLALDTALRLAADRATVPADHALVAPALLRSDALSALYAQVRQGDLSRKEAGARLDHLRKLKIRLLGDRVLQRVAWDIAAKLDWPDTRPAEYIAVTTLQADAFVTLDPRMERAAAGFVATAPLKALLGA